MTKILKTRSDRATVRKRSADPTTNAMFDLIVDHALQHGWDVIFTKGRISVAQFHKGNAKGSYRHSFIVNVDSLNFYLRIHALRLDPAATKWALENLDDVSPNVNGAHETTIKLKTTAEAKLVAEKFLS